MWKKSQHEIKYVEKYQDNVLSVTRKDQAWKIDDKYSETNA